MYIDKMKVNKMGIHIKVKNIKNSLRFYRAFSLDAVFAYGDRKWLEEIKDYYKLSPNQLASEKYCGIVFDVNGALLEIADGHIAVKPAVFQESIKSSKVSLMFDVESVEEIQAICRKNRFDIAVEPKIFPWGTKEIVIKDPDGCVLVFREAMKK